MRYRRLPIEMESPEGLGYENIECNLSESSFTDQRLGDLGIALDDLLLCYSDHRGRAALRELIAGEAGLHADQVLITPGAAAALFIVSTALLEKGDHIVVAKTNYATNIETPRVIGARVSYIPLHFEKGFRLDKDELNRLVTPDTRLLSLTYPHNPTGVTIDEQMLLDIIEIVERNKIYLLFDETYREMNFASRLPVAAALSSRVISVGSMSKSFGLPGIRIGWLTCTDAHLMEIFLAAKEQILITNSVIDEEIAFRYLSDREKYFNPVWAKIKENFQIVKNFMASQNLLEWVEPGGGCVCFPRIKKDILIDTKNFHEILLKKYSTYTGRGYWFEEDDRYFRIGYGWDKTEKLKKGLTNILSCIEELSR